MEIKFFQIEFLRSKRALRCLHVDTKKRIFAAFDEVHKYQVGTVHITVK